jgi:steroid 5-alpha reductase family enzyme
MTSAQFFIGLGGIALALSLVMTIAWLVEQRSGNSGWIDTTWTFGLGAIGALSALAPIGTGNRARCWLIATAVAIWTIRLGFHIAARTAQKGDDPRYAALRRQYGPSAARQMWFLAQKQALVSVPLALAIYLAAHNPSSEFRAQDYIAITMLVAAFVGEAIADWQLRRFSQSVSAAKRICDVGLWRWSRHPNYFFEWLGWLAYPLVAIDLSDQYPWGWLALIAPICIYWLLVHVSGIPPLEAHMLQSRGDAFRAYQARTNAFFPGVPRAHLAEE